MKRSHGGSRDACRIFKIYISLKWSTLIMTFLGITCSSGEVSASQKLSIPRNVVPLTARDTPRLASCSPGEDSALHATAETDEFLTFCVDFDRLPEQLASSRDYRVVAVTGCQCSGKSTLLNALFGSMFPVLEHSPDALPRKTTVGGWVDLQLQVCSVPSRKKVKSDTGQKSSKDGSGGSITSLRPSTSTAQKIDTTSQSKATVLAAAQSMLDGVDRASKASSAAATSRADDAPPKRNARALEKAARKSTSTDAATATGRKEQEESITPFVLVDVEGTQSRDRGNADGVEFDSRTTLFAVMVADVIMLNLWAHDVERADGQAYSVLRSVLEEAVRLLDEGREGGVVEDAAARRGKTLSAAEAARFPKVLMLVLRDVEEEEHFEALVKAMRAKMEALWRDVEKPRSLCDASLSDVFDVRTSGLPHFNYQRRQFAAKAVSLSRSFLDPNHPDFVFSGKQQQWEKKGVQEQPGNAGRQAAVPLSMLRQRLQGIWASASTNDRLSEAPRRSERQGAVAVAAIAESCMSEAREKCARLFVDVEGAAGGPMPLLQFGSNAKGIVDEALRSFQEKTSRAQPTVDAPAALVRQRRRSLVTEVARELEPAFRAHARHLRVHFHDHFEEAFSCILGGAPDFEESWRKMAKSARVNFLEATKLAVPDTAGVAEVWRLHWEAELVKLNEDIEAHVQDRVSEGTWMLPPGPSEVGTVAGEKGKMPRWKGLVLRVAVMYFNYLQATQHLRRAKKASERRERDVPRLPLF